MPGYLLAETMFIIEGKGEHVSDTRIPGKEYRCAGAPIAVVSQAISGDRSHGKRTVEPPSRGDTEYSFSFAADQRLSSIFYKWIGLKDTSAVGAIAEAIAGAPEQLVAGMDAVSKASANLRGLRDAAAERKLEAIKRQVTQRTQELELRGLNATADDFAKLKRQQQKVAMLEAEGALTPASELSKLQNELAGETGRADLEKVQRDRQVASDLAAMQAEIAGLEARVICKA